MKVLTVFGTRPEIIRLSRVIPLLDSLCEHVLIHTGQNFDAELSDVFFRDLELRAPDLHLAAHRPGFAAQIASIIESVDTALARYRPDRILILGDTDSGLAALPAARRGIPVFHMEAGNRCYDARVPEEINRRIIDHASSVWMPYTQRSMQNLLREGIPRQRIFVVGNPIYEVLEHNKAAIEGSQILAELGLQERRYAVATLHRAENVDDRTRIARLFEGLERSAAELRVPVILSLHPRTRARLREFGLEAPVAGVRLIQPLGLFDFVRLQRSATVVLTDSGTVQEECCIYGIPNVTLRDTSERLETVEAGSNIIAGSDPQAVVESVRLACQTGVSWVPPSEYLVPNVASTVSRVVLGPMHPSLP